MGRIVVVTSGKGGAGKSTVSVGLGSALARAGASVLLVDGDAGLRTLDLLLGVGQDVVYDLEDIFEGRCEPIRAIYPSKLYNGVSLVPAPARLEGLCSPTDMRRLCRGFAQHYDFVFIDCPAGTGRGFDTAVAAAESALVVTTPDPICARDAAIVGDLLAEQDVPSRLVINRLRVTPILQGKLPDLDKIIDTAGIQLIGAIPEDDELAVATAGGKPMSERGMTAECFCNIARRLCGEEVPLAPLHKL